MNLQLSVSIEIYLDKYLLTTSKQYEKERERGGGGGEEGKRQGKK